MRGTAAARRTRDPFRSENPAHPYIRNRSAGRACKRKPFGSGETYLMRPPVEVIDDGYDFSRRVVFGAC